MPKTVGYAGKISIKRPHAARSFGRLQKLKAGFPVGRSGGRVTKSAPKTFGFFGSLLSKNRKGVRSHPISGGKTRGDRMRQGKRIGKM